MNPKASRADERRIFGHRGGKVAHNSKQRAAGRTAALMASTCLARFAHCFRSEVQLFGPGRKQSRSDRCLNRSYRHRRAGSSRPRPKSNDPQTKDPKATTTTRPDSTDQTHPRKSVPGDVQPGSKRRTSSSHHVLETRAIVAGTGRWRRATATTALALRKIRSTTIPIPGESPG